MERSEERKKKSQERVFKLNWFLDRWGNWLLLLVIAVAVVAWIALLVFNTAFAFELVVYIAIVVVSIMGYAAIIGLIAGFIKDVIPKRESKKKERKFGYQRKERKFGYRK